MRLADLSTCGNWYTIHPIRETMSYWRGRNNDSAWYLLLHAIGYFKVLNLLLLHNYICVCIHTHIYIYTYMCVCIYVLWLYSLHYPDYPPCPHKSHLLSTVYIYVFIFMSFTYGTLQLIRSSSTRVDVSEGVIGGKINTLSVPIAWRNMAFPSPASTSRMLLLI